MSNDKASVSTFFMLLCYSVYASHLIIIMQLVIPTSIWVRSHTSLFAYPHFFLKMARILSSLLYFFSITSLVLRYHKLQSSLKLRIG